MFAKGRTDVDARRPRKFHMICTCVVHKILSQNTNKPSSLELSKHKQTMFHYYHKRHERNASRRLTSLAAVVLALTSPCLLGIGRVNAASPGLIRRFYGKEEEVMRRLQLFDGDAEMHDHDDGLAPVPVVVDVNETMLSWVDENHDQRDE